MALPVIALPAFLTLVRQVGLTVAKRQVKKRLTKDFLTKNATKIKAADKTFAKNLKPRGVRGKPIKKKTTTKKTTTKKTTTKKTTTKKTPTKTTTPTGTTKPGAKSKVPGIIIGVGTLGGGAMLMKSGGDKGKGGSGMTFNQAFAKARKEKGKLSTFSYKGKMYSTATMEDVKKAGFDNLKDYLNAKKK